MTTFFCYEGDLPALFLSESVVRLGITRHRGAMTMGDVEEEKLEEPRDENE